MKTKEVLKLLLDYFEKYKTISFVNAKKYLQEIKMIELCDNCYKLKPDDVKDCWMCSRYIRFVYMFIYTLRLVNVEAMEY